jgi:putative membrane protein
MIASPEELSRPRFVVEPTAATRFAWFRAWLMLERTIASWVLTAITLIGFGFTIVVLFDQFGRLTGVEPPIRPLAPFFFGLALVGLGVGTLVVAGCQYRAVLRYLRHGDFAAVADLRQQPAQTLVYAVTIVTIFIGVFSFLAIAARVL